MSERARNRQRPAAPAPESEVGVEVEVEVVSTHREQKDVTRNRVRLLQAANVVFARRGADATLNDIAKEAGLGNATVHRHFSDKQQILTATFDDRASVVLGIFRDAESIEDPAATLEHLLRELSARQSQDRGARQALGVDASDETASRVSDELRPSAVRIVERARAAGAVVDGTGPQLPTRVEGPPDPTPVTPT